MHTATRFCPSAGVKANASVCLSSLYERKNESCNNCVYAEWENEYAMAIATLILCYHHPDFWIHRNPQQEIGFTIKIFGTFSIDQKRTNHCVKSAANEWRTIMNCVTNRVAYTIHLKMHTVLHFHRNFSELRLLCAFY